MKSKEEVIRGIYGDAHIHSDINGWIKFGMYCPNDLGVDDAYIDCYGDGYLWRHKSLANIENNNGWISINSESDLPSEECFIELHNSSWTSEQQWTHHFVLGDQKYLIEKGASHYKKIIYNPPLHK